MGSLRGLSARIFDLNARRSPLIWLATSFVVLVCVSLIAVQSWVTWRAREIQLRESTAAAANLAQAVAQHAYDTIKEADTVLVGLVERMEADGAAAPQTERLHTFARNRVLELPQLRGIFIFAPDGSCLLDSPNLMLKNQNNAEREYFIYHRTHADRGVHIGPPIRSKSSGAWIITVSRRVTLPDGGFGGVVLATLKMEYFKTFYERFDIGRSGAIFIALDNGVMLLRRPFEPKALGRNIAALPLFSRYLPLGPVGTAVIASGQDGVTRINSYRRLEQYPLVVSAALSREEALAQWRADAYLQGAAVALLALALALLGSRLIRQIDLRIEAEAELLRARNALEALNQTLEKLAMQDGLTGLANRRQFDLSLQAEFSRAMRDASSLALIMIDVDCFKQYNDIYGHAAGDECLRAIGAAVAQAKRRPGDVTARYGGEEMVVLLPETDVAGALLVAENIRKAIQKLALKHPGNAAGLVTVSAGVNAFAPVRHHNRPIELVESADRALYMAKAGGRNRVCSQAGPPAARLAPLAAQR